MLARRIADSSSTNAVSFSSAGAQRNAFRRRDALPQSRLFVLQTQAQLQPTLVSFAPQDLLYGAWKLSPNPML
jgi:hypothetical protein